MTKPNRPFRKVRELAAQHDVSRATIWRWASKDKQLVEVQRLAPRTGVRVRIHPAYDDPRDPK
jgi:hypothetical protein